MEQPGWILFGEFFFFFFLHLARKNTAGMVSTWGEGGSPARRTRHPSPIIPLKKEPLPADGEDGEAEGGSFLEPLQPARIESNVLIANTDEKSSPCVLHKANTSTSRLSFEGGGG